VTWTSSKTAVATINTNGLATAVSAGATTISAALAGVTGGTTLTVQAPPTLASIAMTPTNPTILVGATQQFTATGTYSDGSTQNLSSRVTWTSSKTAVATINTNGLATAVSAGATVISAAFGGVTATNTLTVQAAPLVMTTISMPTGTVSVAYSATLSATGGTTPYTWSIANGSLPGGLALNTATGAITGTPTNTRAFTFTAQVTDASSPAQTGTKPLSITIASVPAFATIWPSNSVPRLVDDGPDSSVELGVKFRSDVAGFITSIRFYKASANTGTHVGNLWNSAGTRLATATFTNETASGWQQVSFATPVAITSNTVYVASYHANNGHYSEDDNYFSAKGVDNSPLHALTNGVSGGNGVYTYGTSSAFPSQTWNAANYWVDVVLVPFTTIVTNSFTVSVNEVNVEPTLPVQTNRTIDVGTTLTVTNSDLPANTLTYELQTAPTGALIDANGLITWTPLSAQGASTNLLTTVVIDNGLPPLNATNTFLVFVNAAPIIPAPVITSVSLSGGVVTLTWDSVPKGIYQLQYIDDLNNTNWTDVLPVTTATGSISTVTNPIGTATQRFYRLRVVPLP
jgi:hypothetical protein